MKKAGLFLTYLLTLFLLSTLTFAQTYSFSNHHLLSPVQTQFKDNILTISNNSKKPINLQNAILQFHYAGNVAAIEGINDLKFKSTIAKQDTSGKPNNPGNFYRLYLSDVNKPTLGAGEIIKLRIKLENANIPHGFQLLTLERVPVQVRVTTVNANWVQTISVCNISSSPIPLTDIEFNFNYGVTMPTSIWGQPWVAWQLASQTGTQVVLLGGTPWTPPLQPDPNCTNPLTIQFNAAPTSPAPTGPFVFKAAGGTPSGFGTLTINMQGSPASGVGNPQVTVQGMDTTKQQVVNWGTQWQLTNLVPGSYTITATPVDNGQAFFEAPAKTATVSNNQNTSVTINYQPVPSAQVTVTLVNAPAAEEPITLTGQKYTIKRNVPASSTITLPADTYTVTSIVPGYSATIEPNPLIVPTNTTLKITYQQQITGARFVGYFQSWDADSQTTDGTKTNLANLPPYMNVVMLSFMKPDAVYTKGSINYSTTGLEFNFANGNVLKQAIASLHQKNPNTKVLVAVGGATYTNWGSLNAKAIADFVVDFGLDGVDIDYEPATTGCATGADGKIHCQIDAAFQSFVEALRSQLPRPYWVAVTGFSVAAYGEDQWKNATPQSQYTGMMLPLLRSVAAKDIDMVNVMSYDAGTTYDPVIALAAYTNYFAGPISMGVEVPPEAWGGHVYTLCEVLRLTQAVKTTATQRNKVPGMMMWSIQKKPNGAPTPNNPNAQMMATTICNSLGLTNCTQPLLMNGFAPPLAIENLRCDS